MSEASNNLAWHPLGGLRANFEGNVAALSTRYPALAEQLLALKPACDYFVAAEGNRILLARRVGDVVNVLPNPVPAEMARALAQKVFPANICSAPAMVAGLDQGWLWHALYEVPCNLPGIPGHRPPLYLLAAEVERLWVVLHVQQWQKLLADCRSLLFVGPDAVAQARQSMLDHIAVPWPKFCLTVEPHLWAPGMNLEALIADATSAATTRLQKARQRTARAAAPLPPGEVDAAQAAAGEGAREGSPAPLAAQRPLTPALSRREREPESTFLRRSLEHATPLRVLGITSRYTTFLQHSMRDWLGAFDRLGHTTRLLIEGADHEIFNNIVYAETCAEFRPDLIVIIDHYRKEIEGLPDDVPCVMWVQDNLPTIFGPKAGPAQGPLDFCVGFGKYHLSSKYNYPAERFVSATVGVNDDRFSPEPVEKSLLDAHTCDLSFVGHASTPPDVILAEEKARSAAPEVARLLDDVYEQMAAHYTGGGEVLCPIFIRRMIDQAQAGQSLRVSDASMPGLIELFTQRVNNAMYRHQALHWAAELGLDLRLYGKGWENHPTLGRFARGVADNHTQLRAIYQGSRINLQVTPFGAVHQRLLDGLLAGGFFLIRDGRGDRVGLLHKQLWDFCQRHGITSDDQLAARATDDIRPIIDRINWLEGYRYGPRTFPPLFETTRAHAESNFLLCADSVWPEYDAVAFDSRESLRRCVDKYLRADGSRRQLAMSMRRAVVENCTYTAITQRVLDLIHKTLAHDASTSPSGRGRWSAGPSGEGAPEGSGAAAMSEQLTPRTPPHPSPLPGGEGAGASVASDGPRDASAEAA